MEKEEITTQIPIIVNSALGIKVAVSAISELSGGTFNLVYLVEPPDQEKLVVRIAPAEDDDTHWGDAHLMRREYAIQPYFLAVSSLMPSILAVDFTHRILDRDYMIQTFIEGERWDDIEDELTDEVNLKLWQQFGEITRKIHDTVGEHFGWPYPDKSSPTWLEVIIERFTKTIVSMEQRSLNTFSMTNVLAYLHSEAEHKIT